MTFGAAKGTVTIMHLKKNPAFHYNVWMYEIKWGLQYNQRGWLL